MTSSQGGGSRVKPRPHHPVLALLAGLWLAIGGLALPARAALQFDVFLGYDDLVREANWFPVACEVFNDGPTFTGIFELASDAGGRSQARQFVLELPTNTRKRFVIPAFGSGGRFGSWNARLLDQRGRVRAEQPNLRPRREASWETVVLGALPRTFGGLPAMPEVRSARNELQPAVARLQADYFPDNPIALEGLTAIYLNSEKALDLKVNQVNALITWVNGGGHLIVGVEQPGDVNGTPWLRNLLPCQLTGVGTVSDQAAVQEWLTSFRVDARGNQPARTPTAQAGRRGQPATVIPSNPYANLAVDPAFDQATLPVASCTVRDGKVVLSSGGKPMVIEAHRGRGLVTALTFSPEREPFRSWKNRAWFWARLLAIPPDSFASQNTPAYGGHSLDGVFGAMIDSRQIRKLPVSGLLLLLVVYLLVIGPADQYWLKKINRQMLTWITFPCYVVMFSLLIYWIGFMLRAGETEWNELHVVDVLPRGERADWRGRTYASVYSPANARYQLVGEPAPGGGPLFATLRGEFQGAWGGQESSRANVEQRGDGFRAEIFVPVWTSQLYVSDWLQPGAMPLKAKVERSGNQLTVTVENLHPRDLTEARLVVNGRVHLLGSLPRGQSKTFQLDASRGEALNTVVQQQGGQFASAVQQRRQAFGGQSFRLQAAAANAVAASFVSELRGGRNAPYNYQNLFVTPARFDLSSLVDRGDAVLLAWDAGHALTGEIHRFKPRRSSRDTLLRLAIPVNAPTTR